MVILPRLAADKKGGTAIEYAMVATLIAVAAIAGMAALGSQVHDTFNQVNANVAGKS